MTRTQALRAALGTAAFGAVVKAICLLVPTDSEGVGPAHTLAGQQIRDAGALSEHAVDGLGWLGLTALACGGILAAVLLVMGPARSSRPTAKR